MARQRFGERGNRQRFVDLWGENVFVILLLFSFPFIAAHNFQKKNMLAAERTQDGENCVSCSSATYATN